MIWSEKYFTLIYFLVNAGVLILNWSKKSFFFRELVKEAVKTACPRQSSGCWPLGVSLLFIARAGLAPSDIIDPTGEISPFLDDMIGSALDVQKHALRFLFSQENQQENHENEEFKTDHMG